MVKNIKHEDISREWDIWKKSHSVERSIKRLKKELPEMECSKQLTQIVKKYYKKGNKILDFGCAAGHYYNSLKRIDKQIDYTGFDPTKSYIKFAKKFFRNKKNVTFDIQSLFNVKKDYRNKFDIVFCSNVLLHMPSIDTPLRNLLKCSKNHVIIRTLVSDYTHLSKFYFNDKANKKGVLNNFVFQNTYSFNLMRKKIAKIGKFKISFIEDRFNGNQLNKEFKKDQKKYPGLTKYLMGSQIAGSKVFQYKWVVISK